MRRFLLAATLLSALSGSLLVGPAVLAPTHTAAARADVHSSCTVSRCSAARTARTGWSTLSWPLSSGWYVWPYGQDNFTGGTFQNREGELPAGAAYNEYDVYPRTRGAARDAYRIVVNRSTKETWFTPDHYVTFYKL